MDKERGRERRNRSRSPQSSSRGQHKDRNGQDSRRQRDSVQSFSVDLNKLRAKVMKARLTKSSELPELERQLAAAMDGDKPKSTATSSSGSSGVVVLPR
ncbi:hypothetical protein GGI21_004140, partial [Coemansia aciculifera]